VSAVAGPGRVRVLPDSLANQIAAGEVVERPASVIKELCENALDADASKITVEIEGGGVTLCRVTDDGWGMDRDDAVTCLQRHATSKLSTLDDLAAIRSFGFRGEALPSIASVSRFRLETRRRGEPEGVAVTVEGGGAALVEPCGAPTGTRIEVRELFFNVPARRKFLRAFATESAHVTEVVEGIALTKPSLSIVLERDGRKVREHLRATSREERVRDVFPGWELVACKGARGPLTVEAYLSRPERARAGATALRIFVNGRPVRDRTLARAVAFGYGSVLEPGRYPVGVVYLELPHETVDVNVHPQKSEVRFSDGRAVQDAVYRIVESVIGPALGGQASLGVPSARFGRGPAFEAPPDKRPPAPETDRDAPAIVWSGSGVLEAPPVPYPAREGLPAPAAETALPPSAVFLAQVKRMFLLCETDDALLVIDQHAAAERVTFDRLKRALSERAVAMQTLLVPELVDVDASAVALVEEAHDEILAMGMDVRPAGPTRLAVHAVPQILGRATPAELVTSLVGELSRSGSRGYSGAIDLVLATLACHGSIRAGDRVSPEQARELLAALASIDLGGYCPHGRPVVMRLSYRELEHRVGRR
jgi:DNA mismatch repair protein MutL